MTKIKWPSPFGYTDFCDDIRHEVAGKMTFVGIYAGEMRVFGLPPLAIPQLCLAVHYFEDAIEATIPLKLMIHLPTDQEDAPPQQIDIPPRNAAVLDRPDLEPGDDLRLASHFEVRFAPFLITQSGKIQVRMQRGDDVVQMGSLRIVFGTPEEAAQIGQQFAHPPNQVAPPVPPQ